MAISAITRLAAVNLMLSTIAEPEVTATSQSTASKKALVALTQALERTNTFYDWSWLESTVLGDTGSWIGETVRFTLVRKFVFAKWRTANGTFINIPWVSNKQFYTGKLDVIGTNGMVRYWTFQDDAVRVNPHPTLPAERAQLRIGIIREFAQPVNDAAFIAMPPRFVYGALDFGLHLLNGNHVHDPGMSEMYYGKWEKEMYRLKSQEPSYHTGNMSMFGN